LKRIVWHGDSLDRIRKFPEDARQNVGFELERVQKGLEPRDWKPMKTVGPGVVEIRIHVRDEYRVFYLATHGDVIHVLHTFLKKSRKTRLSDIQIAASRYRQAVAELHL
jgi:phage-related protein